MAAGSLIPPTTEGWISPSKAGRDECVRTHNRDVRHFFSVFLRDMGPCFFSVAPLQRNKEAAATESVGTPSNHQQTEGANHLSGLIVFVTVSRRCCREAGSLWLLSFFHLPFVHKMIVIHAILCHHQHEQLSLAAPLFLPQPSTR